MHRKYWSEQFLLYSVISVKKIFYSSLLNFYSCFFFALCNWAPCSFDANSPSQWCQIGRLAVLSIISNEKTVPQPEFLLLFVCSLTICCCNFDSRYIYIFCTEKTDKYTPLKRKFFNHSFKHSNIQRSRRISNSATCS